MKYESTSESLWTFRIGACGGNFTTPNGLLTSPSYPVKYPNNAYCVYTITMATDSYINLSIITFETESSDCLEIRDGKSDGAALIGIFCGIDIPASIQTTQRNVWMRQVTTTKLGKLNIQVDS